MLLSEEVDWKVYDMDVFNSAISVTFTEGTNQLSVDIDTYIKNSCMLSFWVTTRF